MQSKILFNSAKYCVSVTRAGFIVQDSTGGKRLAPSHPQFSEWVEAFETALDAKEKQKLAKEFLSASSV